MYQAPMVETSMVGQVFVSDFVQVTDQHLGVFHGKVQHFYMKVMLVILEISVMAYHLHTVSAHYMLNLSRPMQY